MTIDHMKKVGLLGGSFNPPHEGHVYISRQAWERLGLDEVWWLVSPQNPLKPDHDTQPYNERFQQCESIVRLEDYIVVSSYEQDNGLQYTYDTLVALKQDYPDLSFVWLMGSDNMYQFDTWHRWQDIKQMVPIAVLHRQVHKNFRLAQAFSDEKWEDITTLVDQSPPCWGYVDISPHQASSTELRG